MSDTTITPEERALWLMEAETESGTLSESEIRIQRLLAALEETENYAEKLVYTVTDGKMSRMYDIPAVEAEVNSIWEGYVDEVRAKGEKESARLLSARAEAIATAEAATDDAERLRANLEPAYFISVRGKTLVCRRCGNAHFHPSRRKNSDHVCNSCGALLFKEEIDLMVHADEATCVSTPCPICGQHGHIGDCEGD